MKNKFFKFLFLCIGFFVVGGLAAVDAKTAHVETGVLADSLDPFTPANGEWEGNVVNTETIYSNHGGGELLWNDATTDNTFEVEVRIDSYNVDRNLNLNVFAGAHTFTVDMRQDAADAYGWPRLRVDGGFNASTVAKIPANGWAKFKIMFTTNAVHGFYNDVLFGSVALDADFTNESKTFSLSSWEIRASFKNPRHYNETMPADLPTCTVFDSMVGTGFVNGQGWYKTNGAGVEHHYLGEAAWTTMEFDLVTGAWNEDRNVGIFFDYPTIALGFRIAHTGTFILENGGSNQVFVSGPVLSEFTPHHIKINVKDGLLIFTIDGERLGYAKVPNVSGNVTNVRFWNWNTFALINNIVVNNDPIPHYLVDVAEQGATYNVDGVRAHKVCEYCGALYDLDGNATTLEDLKIPASGAQHEYSQNWTSSAEGHYHVCGVCSGHDEILPHEGTWTEVTPATVLTKGKEERTCTVCSYHEERDIPTLPEPYIFAPGSYTHTIEGGEDVYTSNGGVPSITIGENVDANCFEVYMRHNTSVVDRNTGMHIVNGTFDYFFDYRQDVDAFRFRIGEDWVAFDFTSAIAIDTWFKMKMVIIGNNVKCYVNDTLAYDITDDRIGIDPTNNKFLCSSWDTVPSLKGFFITKVVPEQTGIEIVNEPIKVIYTYGEDLDLTGMEVVKTMTFGPNVPVSNEECTTSGYNKNVLGEQTVTVTNNTFTDEFVVTVVDAFVSLEIKNEPTKKVYKYGEELDIDGLVVKALGMSGDETEISPLDYEVTGYNKNVLGEQTITVSYQDLTDEFVVTVEDYVVGAELVSRPTKTEYEIGETLDLTGAKISVEYASGAINTIDITEDMVTGFDSSVAGKVTITITYGDLVENIELTIKAAPETSSSEPMSSEEASSQPTGSSSEKDPWKDNEKGCLGSVAAVSGLITILCGVSVGLLFGKKKNK